MSWTSPRTWVAGEIPSASTFNTHVRDNFKAIGDPWTAYTPTLGNWTIGNGTLEGYYAQAGKTVRFRVKVTFGSTTSASGSPTFSLPVAAVDVRAFGFRAAAFDTSAGDHYGLASMNSSTTSLLVRNQSTPLSATVPFTWATGDELYISGEYEAA